MALYVSVIRMTYRMCPATETTLYSPYFLLFARHPRLLIDVSKFQTTGITTDKESQLDAIVDRLQAVREIASVNIRKAQSISKHKYDKKQKPDFR